MELTYNESVWKGKFGDEYLGRNIYDVNQLNDLYLERYGISRSAMNKKFLKGIDTDSRILEVGCNCGNQLLVLRKAGFRNLYGVEINLDAANLARQRVDNPIFTGTGADLSFFENNFFDVAFTSGVLMHVSPDHQLKLMSEIIRVSKKYVWGFEYYANSQTEVVYRGKTELLWKNDYAKMYETFFGLKLVKEEKYVNLNCDKDSPPLIDHMFLLEKTS